MLRPRGSQHRPRLAEPGVAPIAAPSIMGLFGFMIATVMLAFLAQSMGLFNVLSTLTAGSALTAAGFYAGSLPVVQADGWLLVVPAAAAWLVAGAMTLEHATGRTIIPLGKWPAAVTFPAAPVANAVSGPLNIGLFGPRPGVRGRPVLARKPGAHEAATGHGRVPRCW